VDAGTFFTRYYLYTTTIRCTAHMILRRRVSFALHCSSWPPWPPVRCSSITPNHAPVENFPTAMGLLGVSTPSPLVPCAATPRASLPALWRTSSAYPKSILHRRFHFTLEHWDILGDLPRCERFRACSAVWSLRQPPQQTPPAVLSQRRAELAKLKCSRSFAA
jgi:hypothetical protein